MIPRARTHDLPLRWVPLCPRRANQCKRRNFSIRLTRSSLQPKTSISGIRLSGFSGEGPSGARTFIYSYRASGGRSARKARHTIGRYGKITLSRRAAQQLAGQVAAGHDPPPTERQRENARDKQIMERWPTNSSKGMPNPEP